MKIVLASRSSGRYQVLKSAGFTIDIRPSGIDETMQTDDSVKDVVATLATRKALACDENQLPVIAADTLVSLDRQVLGQPVDMDHAKTMLTQLSGRTHQIYTGVCVRLGMTKFTQVACTDVTFHTLSESCIDTYLKYNDVLDKSGAYAIQGAAASFICAVNGDMDNVIGLPMRITLSLLKKLESL